MSIKQRIQKLELTNGPDTVIYITDPFTVDDDEPTIRSAHVNGKEFKRAPGEEQYAFKKRANPTGRRNVFLESDAHQL